MRHGTATFKDSYNEAVAVVTLEDGQSLSRVYRFQIPAGTTSLDLDMLDEYGVVTLMPAWLLSCRNPLARPTPAVRCGPAQHDAGS